MGTYTTITITGPNEDLARVKLHKLPDFEGRDGTAWELVTTESRRVIDEQEGNRITKMHYEQDPIAEHRIATSFHTTWDPEDTGQWAHRFTRKRPTLEVVVRKEWDSRDADESGSEEDVFRGGEWVPAESKMNGEVPANISNLLEVAKVALQEYHSPDPLWSITDWRAHTAPVVVSALEALVKGLQ